VLVLALLLCAAPAAAAERVPPPEVNEVPIEIPDPTPTGLLIAWKPAVLSVRVDTGQGNSTFGSDTFEPLRGLGRFTFQILGNKPFFGRVEVEGGRLETSDAGLGSSGADVIGRFLVGAANRITSGVVLTASAGLLTRYEWGSSTGGLPQIGMFGAVSNLELDVRIVPAISLGAFVEGAIVPFPYAAQSNLGDLSDASEFRGRLQLSYDATPSMAIDIGYDFTRWHSAFTNSTILGTTDRALLVESREHAATLGIRFKFRP
jgi:opacity protein-like surface antigen